MKRRIALLTVISLVSVLLASPAHLHAQQPADPADHAAHHADDAAVPPNSLSEPAATPQMTSAAKLEALLEKMNSAQGAAKTDAMAELLTALVRDRGSCEPMMATMTKMMDMMTGSNDNARVPPTAK